MRLAHALDAAPVLAAGRRCWVERVPTATTFSQVAASAELAALCGWEDVRAEGVTMLVHSLQTPLGAAATPAQQALSVVNAFDDARSLIKFCPPELAARAFGTLAANFRRLHANASAAARDSAPSPAESAAAALDSADGAAIEVDGRFVAALEVPAFSDKRPVFGAGFKSHGLEWRLILMPNGDDDDNDGRPRVGLRLLSGWPKKVSSATPIDHQQWIMQIPKPTNHSPPMTRLKLRCATSSASSIWWTRRCWRFPSTKTCSEKKLLSGIKAFVT